MSGRSPRTIIGAGVMGVAVAAALTVVVASSRTPPAAPVAAKFPRPPEGHPVIPTEASDEQPAPRPPQAFCEARDIAMVATSLREAHKRALTIAKAGNTKGAAPDWRDGDRERALAIAFDGLTKRTGACVSRDSELDSQWNQLDSAVLDYGRCIDCTHPQADRLIGCQRMLELVDAAEKSMR